MSAVTGSIKPYAIHHVNFPTRDRGRTCDWYGRVFGMRPVDRSEADAQVLRMSNGIFDLHFTVDDSGGRRPVHFCVEVQDWNAFLQHLDRIGVDYTRPVTVPEDYSRATYLRDPDGNLVEISFHPGWSHSLPGRSS